MQIPPGCPTICMVRHCAEPVRTPVWDSTRHCFGSLAIISNWDRAPSCLHTWMWISLKHVDTISYNFNQFHTISIDSLTCFHTRWALPCMSTYFPYCATESLLAVWAVGGHRTTTFSGTCFLDIFRDISWMYGCWVNFSSIWKNWIKIQ